MTIGISGPAQLVQQVTEAIGGLGTDLRVWADQQAALTGVHLHTVQPGTVISEVYAITTPFDLRIASLEPPLRIDQG